MLLNFDAQENMALQLNSSAKEKSKNFYKQGNKSWSKFRLITHTWTFYSVNYNISKDQKNKINYAYNKVGIFPFETQQQQTTM